MSKKTVRLAILGTGRMADYHAERFQKIKNIQIVAAVDVDADPRQGFLR